MIFHYAGTRRHTIDRPVTVKQRTGGGVHAGAPVASFPIARGVRSRRKGKITMTQPLDRVVPEIRPRPGLPWIRRHAVLAVTLAGAVGLAVGIGVGAAAHTTTVTKVKTNTVYQTIPAAAPSPTPAPSQTAADMLSVGQPESLQDTTSGADASSGREELAMGCAAAHPKAKSRSGGVVLEPSGVRRAESGT